MEKLTMQFLIILFFLLPISAFSSENKNLLIQKNGIVMSIKEIVSEAKGHMTPIDRSSFDYQITVFDKKYIVNLKTGRNIDYMIFGIAPKNIKINISFISVLPKKKIFFDNNFLDMATDEKGEALITDFYPEPGPHIIELRDKNHTVSKARLPSIQSKSEVECSGTKPMKCYVVL